ncbi:hypothetical protein BKA60DRAFT_143466 [Fusarium oxysporum]|nr:hypothetical protein BKA60DRAFT_143466 [Fusarium oxysporum]
MQGFSRTSSICQDPSLERDTKLYKIYCGINILLFFPFVSILLLPCPSQQVLSLPINPIQQQCQPQPQPRMRVPNQANGSKLKLNLKTVTNTVQFLLVLPALAPSFDSPSFAKLMQLLPLGIMLVLILAILAFSLLN